jgi:hypothetical protein
VIVAEKSAGHFLTTPLADHPAIGSLTPLRWRVKDRPTDSASAGPTAANAAPPARSRTILGVDEAATPLESR